MLVGDTIQPRAAVEAVARLAPSFLLVPGVSIHCRISSRSATGRRRDIALRESLSVVSAECRGAKTLAMTFMPVPSVVVRFPVELRAEPSMDLIREIEPDAREVLLVAECFGLEPPMLDLCDQVDAETARFIAEQVLPLSREERGRALRELLHPVVIAAVEACGMADGVTAQVIPLEGALTGHG